LRDVDSVKWIPDERRCSASSCPWTRLDGDECDVLKVTRALTHRLLFPRCSAMLSLRSIPPERQAVYTRPLSVNTGSRLRIQNDTGTIRPALTGADWSNLESVLPRQMLWICLEHSEQVRSSPASVLRGTFDAGQRIGTGDGTPAPCMADG